MYTRHLFQALVLTAILVGVWYYSPTIARAACSASSLTAVSFGQNSSAVQALQECLIGAGYDIPAGATGYYGTQTRSAVQAFYAKVLGLSDWDGLSVGPKGRAALGTQTSTPPPLSGSKVTSYKRASNAEELKKYIDATLNGGYSAGRVVATMDDAQSAESSSAPSAPAVSSPERVSETNVQVRGIDEPDIVKTDGTTIYFARAGYWYGGPMPLMTDAAISSMPIRCEPDGKSGCVVPDQKGVTALNAYPVSTLGIASESIKERGELLLVKSTNTLIILSYPSIVAYDVSNPEVPKKVWELAQGDSTNVVTARLKDDTLYLVTQTYLNRDAPCPMVPMVRGTTKISVACTDLWIPERPVPVDTVYTVLTVNPATGVVLDKVALTLPSGESVVAMFENNLYLASHSYYTHMDVQAELALEAAKPFLTTATYERANRVLGYDISASGKYSEVAQLIEADLGRYGNDERLQVENEMENSYRILITARARDLDRSSIVRISLTSLSLAATGEIPGKVLNQFALDEYNGDVRVAVTVQPDWNTESSMNDVYVLGQDLKEKGSIRDLGLGERVYSARFMGDTAYLVTFRQIDPFYVLDLSVPTAPKKVGELKIPGYSAYLEPLGNDLVLGVGREGDGVKLSVFDVSNPALPKEKAKYLLKEGWTEVEGNHHAFLRDPKHSVFFLPGGNGGYVFSYKNGSLSLVRTIAGYDVKRALYINDYLYVLGENTLTVIDEKTWKDAKTLTL